MNVTNVYFYNNCGNGDIHYSREFVKFFARHFNVNSFITHTKCPSLLQDLQFSFVPMNTWDIQNEPFQLRGSDLFINTWIGTENLKWLADTGATLHNNYLRFSDIISKLQLNVTLGPEENFIPEIDYKFFRQLHIKTTRNILVCSGPFCSGQSRDFNFEPIVLHLAAKYPAITFFLTAPFQHYLPNIVDLNKFYPSQKSNLNEISYVSTKCDIIIGRASGPYCFAQTKQNLLDKNKTFIVYSRLESEGHWCKLSDYGVNGCKQVWYNPLIMTDTQILDTINTEIYNKWA